MRHGPDEDALPRRVRLLRQRLGPHRHGLERVEALAAAGQGGVDDAALVADVVVRVVAHELQQVEEKALEAVGERAVPLEVEPDLEPQRDDVGLHDGRLRLEALDEETEEVGGHLGDVRVRADVLADEPDDGRLGARRRDRPLEHALRQLLHDLRRLRLVGALHDELAEHDDALGDDGLRLVRQQRKNDADHRGRRLGEGEGDLAEAADGVDDLEHVVRAQVRAHLVERRELVLLRHEPREDLEPQLPRGGAVRGREEEVADVRDEGLGAHVEERLDRDEGDEARARVAEQAQQRLGARVEVRLRGDVEVQGRRTEDDGAVERVEQGLHGLEQQAVVAVHVQRAPKDVDGFVVAVGVRLGVVVGARVAVRRLLLVLLGGSFARADLVRVDELVPGIAQQQLQQVHLRPLIRFQQSAADAAEVLVDEVVAVGADLHERGGGGADDVHTAVPEQLVDDGDHLRRVVLAAGDAVGLGHRNRRRAAHEWRQVGRALLDGDEHDGVDRGDPHAGEGAEGERADVHRLVDEVMLEGGDGEQGLVRPLLAVVHDEVVHQLAELDRRGVDVLDDVGEERRHVIAEADLGDDALHGLLLGRNLLVVQLLPDLRQVGLR
mmetsp:Transcript_30720/g.94915  ORF Transcript_30720/g.94915 Transcript_30720/m.94915 type:complete len:609 (-) Transcript_30720:136-1962(-)